MHTHLKILLVLSLVIFSGVCRTHAQINLENTTVTEEVIAENLEVPWEIVWGPDDHIWITERPGRVSRLNPENQELKVLLEIDEVVTVSESGLLGMALHPDFLEEGTSFVYLVYTYDGDLTEKLVRYTFDEDTLINPIILLDNIPANNNHNGSRLVITSDMKLLMTTGDAQNTSLPQNENSLAGKILRIDLDGGIPSDNPDPSSYVWTLGHRNPQGLVIAENGKIYSSEHGPNASDEINIIEENRNYGWPNVEGACNGGTEETFCANNNVKEPLREWTPTLAVAGIDYYNHPSIPEWQNAILLTTLKEDDFRVLKLNEAGDAVVSEEIYLENAYGRLRDVCVSPLGDIYLATSNRDGRGNGGFPIGTDDQIIRLSAESNVPMFELVVNDGTGDGIYEEGTEVTIEASTPNGQEFDEWTGDVATVSDVNSETTTVIVNQDLTITATFTDMVLATEEGEYKMQVRPNPVSTILEIGEDYEEGAIYHSQGKEILTLSGEKKVNLSALSSGIYLLKMQTVDHRCVVRKIVKQ